MKFWDIAHSIKSKEQDKKINHYIQGMVNTNAGITNANQVRIPWDVAINHATFVRWDEALTDSKYPQLDKVGCFPSDAGCVWYNFFYARAEACVSNSDR